MSNYEDIIEEKYDLKSAKGNYNNIEIPESLEFHINKQIKRKNRNKLIFKLSSIAASLVIAFVIGVNASPALADEISRIPGLAPLVELVRFDKGLKSAAENGYVQKVSETREDKGIKITVNNLIFDNKKMVIDYSIEGKELLNFRNFDITDKDGKRLKASQRWGNFIDDNNNNRGTIEITMAEGEKFPEAINFTVVSLEKGLDHEKTEVINGNWAFSIILDKELVKDKGKIVNCNKAYSVGNYNFEIENIRMYPTITYVRVKLDPDYKFNAFKEPYLMDDKGIKYNLIGWSTINDSLIDMQFESGYFNKTKEIYFKASGVYFMTKEDKYLSIDLENKKIIDSSGYGIKFNDISDNSVSNEEIITLEVTDEKVLAERPVNFIHFEDEAYDEKGKKFSVQVGDRISKKVNPWIYIIIPKKVKMPKQLKIKITSVSSGNMGDIKMKLN
ncbi:MAG: DUF4179 domain-containing protein [Clostridiaceae bacterium]